ncbi:MAG: hypothetical protein HZB50_04270 [Chloroflexi bacterium]|nr:hypothetical protein [Chloroflexota bacterium]MBI5963467.1 hypothetical protein [Chloroflexota bacterium]
MSAIPSFDEAFSKDGGWFNPENFHPTDRVIIFDWITHQIKAIIQSHIRNSFSPFEVEFGYINSPGLNAQVVLYVLEDKAYIGLNVGSAVIIFNYFFQALSHPNLLMNIGDPKSEKYEKKKVLGVILNLNSDGAFNATYGDGQPWIEYHPNDSTRLDYARLLSLHSIIFLIEHEIAHLVNGHLALRSHNRLDSFSKQVLEWDADTWAMSQGVARTIKHISQLPHEIPEPIRWVYSSFENGLSAWLFSVTSLFLLNSSISFDIDKLEDYDHPPSPLSASFVLSTTLEYLSAKSTEKFIRKYEEMNHGVDVFMQSLETLSLLTGNSIYRDEIKKAYSEPALYHLQRLISRWKEIRPLLEPYAYVRKLPD